ncbi:MAG TPA: MmgE/PrpD family protein [Burkholderiales bacterium]|nr:MmgE/PrpD family protein [Burkholderiales bacterium]
MTEELARFLAASRPEDIPQAVRREGKRAILNIAGCVLAGREDPAVVLLRKVFPRESALIDAAAATAHDYDDTHLRTVIHATPPVAGVLFALAKEKSVSGMEFLHAFILGMETTCRLGNAVTPGHYERGWHITSTCGVFGAAAAAGKVLGLNENQYVNALGIAATQASGLVEVLGSMARVLNAGFAARNGLAAALLAAEGFQGPARPLEGLRGFVNVFGGSTDFDQLTGRLSEHWEMTQVAYKPYPCGVVLHALVDACLERRESIRDSEKIVVALHPLAVERADRPEPRNALEARLSAHHAVAVAALRGRAGLAEFSDAAAADPALQAFRRRVRVVPDERLDKMAAMIAAGNSLISAPASRSMDDARIEAKLRELTGSRADEWIRFVGSLESTENVTPP